MHHSALLSTSPAVRAAPVVIKPPGGGSQRSRTVGDYCDTTELQRSAHHSEKLTLAIFAGRYHDVLPLSVRVCRGYCGPNEETSISEGDRFNMHFIKQTTVVAMEYENLNRYNVPLNSSIPFGIIYESHLKQSEALRGYRFEKVSDILQSDVLPKVIRSRRAHRGAGPDSSIAANELLLVRKATKKIMGKPSLKVLSLTAGKEKTLLENCIGHFSTKPREVCLYLPEIVKHLPDIFPCKAVMFNNDSGAVYAKLSTSVVRLLHSSIETSLVATSALEEDTENARLLDIPIDLDILVRVVTSDELETRKLYTDTTYLYNHFDPAKLCPYVNKVKSHVAHETQSLLYTTVRIGGQGDHKGVEVKKPAKVPAVPPRQNVPSRPDIKQRPLPPEPFRMSTSPPPEGDYDVTQPLGGPHTKRVIRRPSDYSYIDVNAVRSVRLRERSSSNTSTASNRSPQSSADGETTDGSAGAMSGGKEEGKGGASDGGQRLRQNAGDSNGVISRGKERGRDDSKLGRVESAAFDSMLSELDHLHSSLDNILSSSPKSISSLESPIEIPNLNLNGDIIEEEQDIYETMNPIDEIEKEAVSVAMIERNKRVLKSLDNIQVLRLLEMMGLKQYQDTFVEQRVNGDLLSDCDEDILKNELHISQRLHRMRLLKVISGQYSIQEMMLGNAGYVTMFPSKCN